MKASWFFRATRRALPIAALGLSLGLIASPVALAQESGDDAQTEESAEDSAEKETKEERKARRQREKQARIDAYYARKAEKQRQREERRLAKEAEKAEKEALRAAERADAEAAKIEREAQAQRADDAAALQEANAAEAVSAAELSRKERKKRNDMTPEERDAEEVERELEPARLPKKLAAAQQSIRKTDVADDPTVVAYLDRIDAGTASPQEIGAVANFIADAGLVDEAVTYYKVALSEDKKDTLLWMNYGVLRRRQGDAKAAASAFARSLSLDPNNARAHYNLGAVLDEMGKYDAAVDEYKLALTLDPELGDPQVNPQAANNDRLVAVKLLLYGEQDGGLVLPLAKMDGN